MSPTTTVTTTTDQPPPELAPGLTRLAKIGVYKANVVTNQSVAYAVVQGQAIVAEGETPAVAIDALATAAEAVPRPV